MANAGVPADRIKQIGGWKDQRNVERYTHLGDEALLAALEKLDELVEGGKTSSQCITPTPEGEDLDSLEPVN